MNPLELDALSGSQFPKVLEYIWVWYVGLPGKLCKVYFFTAQNEKYTAKYQEF